MTDITSLSGDALWAALTSGKRISVQPKDKLEELFPNYKPLVERWVDKALVLIVHQSTCTSCGTLWENPNPLLLLKRYRKRDNCFHFQSVHAFNNILARCEGLPREIKLQTTTVPFCAACFTSLPDSVLLQHQIDAKQKHCEQKDRLSLIKAAARKIQ